VLLKRIGSFLQHTPMIFLCAIERGSLVSKQINALIDFTTDKKGCFFG